MKNIIALFLTVCIFSACKKDFLKEEPKGQLLPEGFFKTNASLELAVTGMYSTFNLAYNIDEFDAPLMGADDVTTRATNKETYRAFDLFAADNTNERMTDTWKNHYALISATNFVINGYSEAIEATQKERDLAAGQAYFSRAYAYFYLVRVWNRIPLILTNKPDYTVIKSEPQKVYDLIISDLTKAENLLPNNWNEVPFKIGIAPTTGSAKALLASVYLNMAGYPLKDISKYALAATKAKEVIDNSEVYGYRLLTDFDELWRDKKFNSEIVFGLIYNNTSSANVFADLNVRAPFPTQPEEEGGWDDYFAEINFFNNFPAGPRKDATFQTVIRKSAISTISWQQGVQKHPYYKKMRAANGEGNLTTPWEFVNWMSSRTNMLIRYAEVKLIYAEAQAMASGVDASTYKEVNDVRIRAGLTVLPQGLSQTAFRDSVVQERAWEFAGNEMCSRWYDLVRLERVEQANANRHPDEMPLTNQPTKSRYFAPIPAIELQLNPNLAN